MKLSNSMKKILAYVCAITMVISSVAFSGPTTIKASDSASVDGRIYTVTDGDASITGFTCQGIFDKARIHFAWETEVDAASITATVDGKSITVDGKNDHGMFIPLTEVSGLANGEYPIVVTGACPLLSSGTHFQVIIGGASNSQKQCQCRCNSCYRKCNIKD